MDNYLKVEFDTKNQYVDTKDHIITQFCPSQHSISGTVRSITVIQPEPNNYAWLIEFTNDRFCKININNSCDYDEPIYEDFIDRNITIKLLKMDMGKFIEYDLKVMDVDSTIGYIVQGIENINDINVYLSLGG
jgi:hypothetical protein